MGFAFMDKIENELSCKNGGKQPGPELFRSGDILVVVSIAPMLCHKTQCRGHT